MALNGRRNTMIQFIFSLSLHDEIVTGSEKGRETSFMYLSKTQNLSSNIKLYI